MSSIFDRLTDRQSMDLIAKMEDAFKSLPHLPKGLVEFLVKIAPWLTIIFAIIIVVFGPLGALAALISLLALNPVFALVSLVTMVIAILTAILYFMAFKPLQARALKGWIYLFWAEMLSVVSAVLGLLSGSFSIGTIIGILIGFYVLFEMKPFYSGSPLNKVAEAIETA